MSVAIPVALLAGILLTNGDDGDSDATSPSIDPGADVDIGDPLPDFTLNGLDGEPVSLSDFRGSPLVLTFFASWCHPCEQEMPLLEDAHNEQPDDFDVLAVSYDDLENDSRAFVERLGVTYPVALDLEDQVKDVYGVRGIPQTFFVDADGVLQDRVFGITSRDALDEPLDALLTGS